MSIRGNDNPNFCFEDAPTHQENQRPEKCVVSELEAVDITPVPKHAEDGDSSDLYFEDKECEGDRLGRLIEQFWTGVSSLINYRMLGLSARPVRDCLKVPARDQIL